MDIRTSSIVLVSVVKKYKFLIVIVKMFNKQPEFLKRLVYFIYQSKFLRTLFTPLKSFYHQYVAAVANRRRKNFVKNGLDVLSAFDKCLTENGFAYSLAFGTMLGAVREKGLIKHDFDLDVVLWEEDYTLNLRELLEKVGFRLEHELLVDEGRKGREETYILNGVTIDIFYIYPAIDEHPYCCDFYKCEGSVSFEDSMRKFGHIKARRLQMPWKKDFIRVPFETLKLPICSNAHEILTFRYGIDYMIPNPQWNCLEENKFVTIWKEELATWSRK